MRALLRSVYIITGMWLERVPRWMIGAGAYETMKLMKDGDSSILGGHDGMDDESHCIWRVLVVANADKKKK